MGYLILGPRKVEDFGGSPAGTILFVIPALLLGYTAIWGMFLHPFFGVDWFTGLIFSIFGISGLTKLLSLGVWG